MNPRSLSLIVSAAVVSGVVGAVYAMTLKTGLDMTLAMTAVVYFVLGAVPGLGCGWVAALAGQLVGRSGERPLVVTLAAGVVLGVLVGLATRQDVLLCAMVGEVGALILSPDKSSEAVY